MQEPMTKSHVSNFWNSTLTTSANQSPVHIRGRACHSVTVATTITLLAYSFCEDQKKKKQNGQNQTRSDEDGTRVFGGFNCPWSQLRLLSVSAKS